MKNRIEVLLSSIAIMALPLCSSAQVTIGNTIPSLPVSSNPISTGVSTGSATAPSQCIQSSVTNAKFVFNTTTNPVTYTFSYTCTFTMNGTLEAVNSVVQDGSSTCLPSQSSLDCKNEAMDKAGNHCSTYCANDQ